MNTGQLITQPYHSPCGTLLLGVHEATFCLCDWVVNPRHEQMLRRLCRELGTETVQGDTPLLQRAKMQLDEYFQGHRQAFDLPLRWVGTEFQRAVWQVLQTIPYGQTRSYMEQAVCLGRPKAVRAVANANALNAMAIIVPCHRVIGNNGKLTGFAGGLNAKRFLLELEGRL